MNSKNDNCKCKGRIIKFSEISGLEKKLDSYTEKRAYDSIIPKINFIPFEEIVPYLKLKNLSDSNNTNIDPVSGARVKNVMPYELPSGQGWKALGMYDPSTHTIYIANNLSYREREFVYHHEVAHALGVSNEAQADNYAQSKVGYMIPGRERYHRLAV
jgi:hypothetical protein